MALIKLNRINKGGEILINSDRIDFVEIESKSTTIHMTGTLLFSVQESPEAISEMIEAMAAERIAKGIAGSGLGGLTQK